MELYIDESGNTGQTMVDAGGYSNFEQQPFFALGGILIVTKAVKDQLETFVKGLIQKYRIQSPELKASGVYEKKPALIIELFNRIIHLGLICFVDLAHIAANRAE